MKITKKTVFLIVGGSMILIGFIQLRTPHYVRDQGGMIVLLLAGIVIALFGTKRGPAGVLRDGLDGRGKTLPEQIRSVEFHGTTSVDRAGMIAAATKTAERVSEAFSGIRVEDIQADGMRLSIRGLGGIVTQMSFTVSWVTANDGSSSVDISVGQFLTSRSTILFIPLGRRRTVALPAMRRFRDGFVAELGAVHLAPGPSAIAGGHTAWDLLQEPEIGARAADTNGSVPPRPEHVPLAHRTSTDHTAGAAPYASAESSLSAAELYSRMYSLKAEAANPATSAARLDQLARQEPFTREDILINPSSGPGLRALIAQLNRTSGAGEPQNEDANEDVFVASLPVAPEKSRKSRSVPAAVLWVVPLAAVAFIVIALSSGAEGSLRATTNDTPGQQNASPAEPATNQQYTPDASTPPPSSKSSNTSPSSSAVQLPTPTQGAPSPSTVPVSQGDLGLANPIRQPACNGAYIVIFHSVIDPGTYAQEIQANLDLHAGSNYLITQGSCRSLNPISKDGTVIYAVYGGPFSSLDSACVAAVRFPDAYVKKLDNITAPDLAVQSCE